MATVRRYSCGYSSTTLLPLLLLVLLHVSGSTASNGKSSLVSVMGDKRDAIKGMWCPMWRNYICGSDGVTYWNECIFEANKQTKSGLEIIKPGSCEEIECDCDEDYFDESADIEICGSNAQIFKSRCEFECYTDVYSHLIEVYDHCRRGFPTRKEVDKANIGVIQDMFAIYSNKYQEIVNEYDFRNISMDKYTFTAEIGDNEVKVKCRKMFISDMSNLKFFEPMSFYAYSDVYGRIKLGFELHNLELRVKRLSVTGRNVKLSTKLKIVMQRNEFELIADLRGEESDCPYIHAVSVRLVDVDNVTVTLKPSFQPSTAEGVLEGVVKEKLVTLINDVVSTSILQKLSEVPCLERSPSTNGTAQCYGFFQMRLCI